jgi:endonuclease YncB( thermonuclease family)
MPLATAALACLVVSIADGDTLTARCDTPTGPDTLPMRLAEIDAPEKGQAFGTKSREHLAELCFKKPATVRPRTLDRYGRTVARVECAGTDASAEQIRAGMAWVSDRYVTDRSLYALQDEARGERPGLWVDSRWRRGSGGEPGNDPVKALQLLQPDVDHRLAFIVEVEVTPGASEPGAIGAADSPQRDAITLHGKDKLATDREVGERGHVHLVGEDLGFAALKKNAQDHD